MSRKTFVEVAKIVAEVKDFKDREFLAEKLGNCFASKNDRFDFNKWNTACNVN